MLAFALQLQPPPQHGGRRDLAGALAGNRIASRVDASRLTAAIAMLLVAVAICSLRRTVPGLV